MQRFALRAGLFLETSDGTPKSNNPMAPIPAQIIMSREVFVWGVSSIFGVTVPLKLLFH